MKLEDCEGCKYFQVTTYKSCTGYTCLRNVRPIHLIENCPKDTPMTTMDLLETVKMKMLGIIGDCKDTTGELKRVVKWIESIEQESNKS